MTQIKKLSFLLICTFICSFFSCEKIDLEPTETNTLKQENTLSIPIIFNTPEINKNANQTKTILGKSRENPFEVGILAEAMNRVYGTSVTKMSTTHLYIKFTPQNLEEIRILDDLDLVLFDFPLERKVIEMGDYYFESDDNNTFPELYTVVESGFDFPNISYEIKAELNLAVENDPYLLRESFKMTGNDDEIAERFPNGLGETSSFDPTVNCYPECPGWPCCLADSYDCEDDYYPDWCRDFDPDCYPGLPGYPNCIDNDPPNNDFELNDCGCIISSNHRNPGGCVRVQDTELGMEGVRKVKVIGWNGWFRIDRTHTDDNGCWRIDRNYRGKAYFWIKFKGEGKKIRGARSGARLWEHQWTVQDYVGLVHGPVFNNIVVNYNMWSVQSSQAHRFWGAASTNNAYEEFQDYAESIGIAQLPNLNIYVAHRRAGQGFALMTNYLGPDGLGNVIANGLHESRLVSNLNFLDGVNPEGGLDMLDQLTAVTGGLTAAAVSNFIPDVMVGINHPFSDFHRDLVFHEFAHASLFLQVGPSYWEDLATAEITAFFLDGDSWGFSTSLGAGRIAIVESWAEHIGHVFTDMKYGTMNNINANTYLARLEETRNDAPMHIPIGIYHDMFDTGIEPTSFDNRGGGSGVVLDAVSGITNSQIFNLFDASVTSPLILRDRINTSVIPGSTNTEASINSLFASY